MTRLFGTDGIRGVANADLSPELAFRLGEAAGRFLGDGGRGHIVIGRDTRRSGDMLEAALVAGVCSGGADALVCGIIPTPAVAFLAREMGADGGVVISASHNPSEYNGFKLFDREGFKLPDEFEDEIAAFLDRDCDWDGTDINHECGSTHVGPLKDAVLEHEADLGLAHDGDADRVLAVDDAGVEVDGDEIMAICAVHMKESGALAHDTVVVTVMSNLGFEIAMREHGIQVVKTKVGDRYVLDGMRAGGASLGGEQSGHIIFMDHGTTGDGLVTAVRLCSTVRDAGTPLSRLRQVMRRYPQILLNVRVSDRGRVGTNAAIAGAIHEAETGLGADGRVLVRASGTEPLVRVMVEARDEGTAAAVAQAIADVVEHEIG